jgi:translocation and assembly module TamB
VTRTVEPRGRSAAARGVAAITGAPAGTARITGTLDFGRTDDPAFDLTLHANELLAARRRDAELTLSGRGTLRGSYRQPIVGGDVHLDRGALYLDEIYRQYLIVDLEDPRLFDAIDTTLFATREVLPPSQSPFLRNLVVDNARVTVGSGSWLRSRDMNVEITGDVIVAFDRRREELRLTGSFQAVRGTYQLYFPPITRRFEIEHGSIDFPGTPGLDPGLAITANYRARSIHGDPLEITAHVSGSLDNPRVRLASNAQPPISESDLASYLFFGVPTNALAVNSAGGATGGFGEFGVRTFGPSALGFVASGLQTLAQSTGVIDYIGVSPAETRPGQQHAGIGGIFADAQLDVGLYLTPEVFAAFTQRLASPGANAGVRVEWRFHPTYSAEIFAEDRFARTPSFGFSQVTETRKIYGFFLFREFGY